MSPLTESQDFAGSPSTSVTPYEGAAYPRRNYRSEIADIIDYYTIIFVGREQEWTRLADFARQQAPGYLLVEALPGYGKSALMAHLIHRHETSHWDRSPVPNLLYFFIRQQGKRNTPVAFLQALNSQLLDTLRLPGGVPTDLDALQSQFNQLWPHASETATPTQPLLVLVDGLDEMAAIKVDEVNIAQLLPVKLAPYVHIIVSSRPNPEPLQHVALEHPLRKADRPLRLQTFGEAEVQAFVNLKVKMYQGERRKMGKN